MSSEPMTPAYEAGPNFSLPEYAIAPEDADLAREIEDFDPVADTAGNATLSNADLSRLPSTFKATSLPPHLRTDVEDKLRDVPAERREERESQLVAETLREIALQSRIASGLSADANAFQREMFEIAGESQRLEREAWDIHAKLSDVSHWEPVYNEAGTLSGNKAVEKVQGQPRKQLEARLKEIDRHLADLKGPAGHRRLAKAKFEAVQQVKAQRRQIDELHRAKKLAEDMVSEERVRKLAEGLAKRHRNTF